MIDFTDCKINYFNYIIGLENDDCNQALFRMFPRINLNKINEIIDETPFISEIRKNFYKKIIKMRYDMILGTSYQNLSDNM